MRRPTAIAVKRENAFSAAADSARNACLFMVEFMYGTPERTRVTMLFALGLAFLGGFIYSPANAVCAL